jgi:exodeoxyribonuclease VII small subunit
MKKTDKGPRYAAAFDELQKILQRLESGDIDVDELTAQVKRAAELIDLCQKRLKETEVEVKKVVAPFAAEEEKDR